MKVEDCIYTVERRSVGGEIDLAFVFVRRFAAPILRLTLLFMIPSCLLVWWLASTNRDTLWESIFWFVMLSPFLGAALVNGLGPQVFGVPFRSSRAIRIPFRRMIVVILVIGSLRLVQHWCFPVMGPWFPFWAIIPGLLLGAYFGALAEVMLLEHTKLSQILKRLNGLSANGGFWRGMGRMMLLIPLHAVLSIGLFILIDLLASMLFSFPIISSRLAASPDVFQELGLLLSEDPRVITTLQAVLWLPYPITRTAWFFGYLDQRIRNECWDLELQFRIEANRLETAA